MPVGGNRHPSDSPAVCCAITRPITNTGEVSSPTSRLYSSQAETAEPTSEQREDTDACINSYQRASGPWLARVAGGITDRARARWHVSAFRNARGSASTPWSAHEDQSVELDAAIAREPGTDAQRGLTRCFCGRRPPLAVGAVFLLIDSQQTVWRRQDTASQYMHERTRKPVSK